MREIMQHSWKIPDGLLIEDIGNNAFIFNFSHQEVRDRIFNDGPWSFLGQLLILKPWNPYLTINEVEIRSTPVWIQIHGLLLIHMKEKSILNVAASVGPVLEH